MLPGKSHGRRSQIGCNPWGRQESDTTERLPFHFSLSCIGGGNGNLLQCSCLENPRDGGAWWAAVYGVAQSGTRLKRLSSSSSGYLEVYFFPQIFEFSVIYMLFICNSTMVWEYTLWDFIYLFIYFGVFRGPEYCWHWWLFQVKWRSMYILLCWMEYSINVN